MAEGPCANGHPTMTQNPLTMTTATVTSKGQITIPAKVKQSLNM